MGFRDEEVATRAKVESLEDEVARLKAENEALRRGGDPPKPEDADDGAGMKRAGLTTSVVIGLVAVLTLTTPFWLRLAASLGPIFLMVGVLLLWFAIMVAVVARLLVIVPPNRIAVFSGRRHIGPDGETRGYRVISGGRALRVPILEVVDELPAGPFDVELDVRRVYTRGGDAANVRVRAIVSVVRHEPAIHRAVERFLAKRADDIARVAAETVEGALRAVVAELPYEAIEAEPEKLAAKLEQVADEDLAKLGLTLDRASVDVERA